MPCELAETSALGAACGAELLSSMLCRDSHGDVSAPVSRTSSLQHAGRSLHDGRNGDSSLEHTPPRVMRSVSAPGSGVKDDASTRSISSDTVRRVSHCCAVADAAPAGSWRDDAP
jgi:hypothetical protein